MNRERSLTGSNGYGRELGVNPLDWLRERISCGKTASWLDLCCGSGTALIEAAEFVHAEGLEKKASIIGVDLVGMFAEKRRELTSLSFIEASLSNWQPAGQFDLITCVHGLHYIGNKLEVISRAGNNWLV